MSTTVSCSRHVLVNFVWPHFILPPVLKEFSSKHRVLWGKAGDRVLGLDLSVHGKVHAGSRGLQSKSRFCRVSVHRTYNCL